MAEAAAAGATPLLLNLPDEIVLWEILVRLDPKSLLRCRAVRRAWRCATTNRRFLLAHHARQPALPVVRGRFRNILAFDHRAAADAQLHTVARLAEPFVLEASCDGLLVLSDYEVMGDSRTFLSICNPATRQHASPGPLPDFYICGMYPHRPTGEYRLLLQRMNNSVPKDQTGWYVLALGSDQPPRHLRCSEIESLGSYTAPVRNYESEVWDLKYRVELPIAQIQGKLEGLDGDGFWYVTVTSGDGDVLLLVYFGGWLFYVDTDGVLVASFHDLMASKSKHRLKQTLVLHDFFTTLEGYAVDASPFI